MGLVKFNNQSFWSGSSSGKITQYIAKSNNPRHKDLGIDPLNQFQVNLWKYLLCLSTLHGEKKRTKDEDDSCHGGMNQHGPVHSDEIPEITQGEVSQHDARPEMKSPDKRLCSRPQMTGCPGLHIVHHPHQEEGNGDAVQDTEKDGHLGLGD